MLPLKFPISRDPPEGGTSQQTLTNIASKLGVSFQFLGIPPKGERYSGKLSRASYLWLFPISRDPPDGGTLLGGPKGWAVSAVLFPISRDPPEGGTGYWLVLETGWNRSFQFLGIPPKGELLYPDRREVQNAIVSNF